MSSHAYVQMEDLGLTVLGTTQTSYTVNGVHGQDFDTAVYRAALCRCTGIENALASYEGIIRVHQKKLDDLGMCIADINRKIAEKSGKDLKSDTKINISCSSTLRRYGFDAYSQMEYSDLMKLLQNVQYAMDQEDNKLQQDMNQMQSLVSKRDSAIQMSSKFMKKIAQTRQKGVQYVGS